MTDLTPDEVMAAHRGIHAYKKSWCASCDLLWPCDAYQMAKEVKELEYYRPCEACRNKDHEQCTGDCASLCCALDLSEARVEALEVVVRGVLDLDDSLGTVSPCHFCDELTQHTPMCFVSIAVELMKEGEHSE